MRLVWDESAWEDYKHWRAADRKILKRINTLAGACLRDPFSGIGKPEQLKYGAQGPGRGASPTNTGWFTSWTTKIS